MPTRLTKEQCDEIAERLAAEIARMDACEALRRYSPAGQREVAVDNDTGLAFRHFTHVQRMSGQGVVVMVAVWPEPRPRRTGGLMPKIAEALDEIRWHRAAGHAMKSVTGPPPVST
jgi:hypothetical protein